MNEYKSRLLARRGFQRSDRDTDVVSRLNDKMNIVLSLLLALQSVHHAYACTKDQCYKQVAGSISGSPADSVRKADCSAALR